MAEPGYRQLHDLSPELDSDANLWRSGKQPPGRLAQAPGATAGREPDD